MNINKSLKLYKKELEEIEITWKTETLRLLDMVKRLKDENKRINDVLINTKSAIINQQEGLSKIISLII